GPRGRRLSRPRQRHGDRGGRPVSEPPRSLYVTADGQPWLERRPGIHWKILWEEGDRKAVLMRYAPGATIPRHRHAGDEQIFVLEGAVSDDTGTCTRGNYARRPPGCTQSPPPPSSRSATSPTSGTRQPRCPARTPRRSSRSSPPAGAPTRSARRTTSCARCSGARPSVGTSRGVVTMTTEHVWLG